MFKKFDKIENRELFLSLFSVEVLLRSQAYNVPYYILTVVFHFEYSEESLEKRSKVFGRLTLITALILILLFVIQISAQEEDFGWNLQETEFSDNLNDVVSIDFDNIVVVGDQGTILTTGDAGVTWSKESSPISSDLNSVDVSNTTVIAVGDDGKVIKRDPSGTWSDISPSGVTIDFHTISIAPNEVNESIIAFVGGLSGQIWKTTDGGDNWIQLSTFTTETINGIDFFNSSFGLAVGTSGLILGTLDSGMTWELRDAPTTTSDFNDVVFKHNVRAYIVGTNGIFLRSAIGDNPIIGYVWKSWETNTTQDFFSVDASSVNKVWVTGLDGLVLNTRDGGNLFKPQKVQFEDADLMGITVLDGETGYIVGSSGTILFTATGGQSESETQVVRNYDDPLVYLDHALPILFTGFLGMIKIIFASVGMGFVLGLIFAVMKTVNNRFLNLFGTFYTDLFRNTPLIVQIFLIHFGLAQIGIDLTIGGTFERSTISSILSLGLNSGAYQAEIIRSGILAIPTGQMEAGRSLGLGYIDTMRYVILPQAVRIVIPPLGNEFVNLTLNSSLASFTGLHELFRSGRLIVAATFKTFQTWVLVAMFYFVITYSMTNILRYTEKKTKIPGLGLGEV